MSKQTATHSSSTGAFAHSRRMIIGTGALLSLLGYVLNDPVIIAMIYCGIPAWLLTLFTENHPAWFSRLMSVLVLSVAVVFIFFLATAGGGFNLPEGLHLRAANGELVRLNLSLVYVVTLLLAMLKDWRACKPGLLAQR